MHGIRRVDHDTAGFGFSQGSRSPSSSGSPRVFTMRSSILTVLLLSFIVTCCARVSSRNFQYDVTFTGPLRTADLQQQNAEQDAAGIIMWNAKPDGLDSGEMFSMGYKRGVADSQSLLGYDFLPSSNKPLVYVFLLLVFGFLFVKAAGLISDGSNRLLSALEPGQRVITGLLFKTLPASFIILAIAFAGSSREAEVRAEVGIGLLAGTTALMLSLVLGASIIAGRCDLESDGKARDKVLNNGWSLTETGVTVRPVKFSRSVVMPICVVLPYLVAQIPVTFGWSDSYAPLLLTFGLSIVGLYGLTKETGQTGQTGQKRKPQVQRSPAKPEGASTAAGEKWLSDDGSTPSDAALRKVFAIFDKDGNGMSRSELYAFILALGLANQSMVPGKSAVGKWMKKFDSDDNGMISIEEFLRGMKKVYSNAPTMRDLLCGSNFQESSLSVFKDLLEDEEEEERARSQGRNKCLPNLQAALYLIGGLAVAAVVTIPLVECIENFSKLTSISPVLVSFVAIPLLFSFQEGLSSASIAGKKTRKSISIAFSEIFGVLFLNNFLPLALFVVILFFKGVKWDFLPEVLVILIAYLTIGIVASVRSNFPLWIGILALLLYPVYIALEVVFHLYILKP